MPSTWEIDSFDRVLEGGRTCPLLCTGTLPEVSAEADTNMMADLNSISRTIVVKALGQPEVSPTGLLCEYFGNKLARHFDVHTPEPVLVYISETMAEIINLRLKSTNYNFRIQPGVASATQFISGLAHIMPLKRAYLPKDIERAWRAFVFDMLVQNPDRRTDKPNCAIDNDKLLVFDFETCFSFIYAILSTEPAWKFGHLSIAQNHVLYADLRGKVLSFRPFLDKLCMLDEPILDEMVTGIPMEWTTSFQKIKDHLLEVASSTEQFERELIGTLIC